jgi:hypothetical protein
MSHPQTTYFPVISELGTLSDHTIVFCPVAELHTTTTRSCPVPNNTPYTLKPLQCVDLYQPEHHETAYQ